MDQACSFDAFRARQIKHCGFWVLIPYRTHFSFIPVSAHAESCGCDLIDIKVVQVLHDELKIQRQDKNVALHGHR